MPHNVDLILGTAQFGLDYGITNREGRVSDEVLDAILGSAQGQLRWLDSSIKYGDALARLGRDSAQPFSVVTKIDGIDAKAIADEITQSLRLLRRDRLDVVLFHTPSIFEDRQRALEAVGALHEQVELGRVSRIGASLYDTSDVERTLAVFTPDVVQLPASIADTRLLNDGTARALHRAGIDIHYRSVFLQGLLLADRRQLPTTFESLAPLLSALDDLASRHSATRQQLCMAWVMSMPGARGLVCGLSKREELDELLASYTGAVSLDLVDELAAIARSNRSEESVLDPRQWAKQR
ncbi:aldo/keto reductase [Devosia sediminis]|uniref:Aldo/keto reductase n=1 Tax=Devosia sediminis TaxID=2798801 RepID=A0A934IZF6_9HYPH|nr:aldo/keto reductase [Devosia sediminis]MBJ3785052.1 aldo/keto reductase [Devosia sediminis]